MSEYDLVKTSYTSLFLDYFGDFLGSPEPSGLVKNRVQLCFLFYDSNVMQKI